MSDLTKPNCYKCAHRGTVPGSAHSRCNHPGVPNLGAMGELMSIFASVGRAAPLPVVSTETLHVKGNEHGIRNGWFNWPYNFDPVWLQECDGFTARQDPKP